VIEVRNLSKNFGIHKAISDLSFTIENSRIYGFLGPNGAGKTTTMNIMTGCLAASSGRVLIDGYDIFDEAEKAKMRLGYLPEQPPLYPDMSPRGFLLFVGRMKGIAERRLTARVDEIMETTRITEVRDRQIKYLSKGYRQRVGLAQAILGNPETLILDEPSSGLDPRQIIEMRELIKALGKTHTVVLSSHILSEVRAVCDTVIVFSKGRIVAIDTPENLEKLFAAGKRLELKATGAEDELRGILSDIPGVRSLRVTRDGEGSLRAVLEADERSDISGQVYLAFRESRLLLLSMNTEEAGLEDVFMELTADGQRAGKITGDGVFSCVSQEAGSVRDR
jgi:ABC-2 type transport system ATP-binding protein